MNGSGGTGGSPWPGSPVGGNPYPYPGNNAGMFPPAGGNAQRVTLGAMVAEMGITLKRIMRGEEPTVQRLDDKICAIRHRRRA